MDRYTILQQKRDWPAKERIEHSKHADTLLDNHKCCATVSVRYWSAEHNINKYEPKYEISEFIAYMGGLLTKPSDDNHSLSDSTDGSKESGTQKDDSISLEKLTKIFATNFGLNESDGKAVTNVEKVLDELS
ncbi:unnamed protein product, partial [Medioppia subpectinata]